MRAVAIRRTRLDVSDAMTSDRRFDDVGRRRLSLLTFSDISLHVTSLNLQDPDDHQSEVVTSSNA